MIGTTAAIHSGHKGDTVVVAAHRVGHAERVGEILEVLGEPDHVHYRVRWADTGNESVLYPSSDATIRPAPRRSATKKSQ
jgi:Domain of unknown function (DUF1918)